MRNAVEDTGTMCRAPLIFRFCFYTIRYSVKTYLQIHTLQLFFSAHEAPPVLRAQTLCDEVCGQPVKRVEHPFLLPSIYIQRGGVSILRFWAILRGLQPKYGSGHWNIYTTGLKSSAKSVDF